MKRIVVMTPKYSDYEVNTKHSIKRAIHYLPYEFIFLSVPEVYIHAGRRKLLTKALELHQKKPFDYFFWLDSDIEFIPEDIVHLIEFIDSKQGDIISGLYFSRHGCNNPMVCMGNSSEGYDFMIDWKINQYHIIEACGFGFIMLSAQAIFNYISKYPSTDWFQSSGWFPEKYPADKKIYVIGEDLYFCENIKKLGYKIWLDTYVLLTHKGIGIQDWKRNKTNMPGHCPVKIEEFIKKPFYN